MFVRTKRRGPYTYLMLVENDWVEGKVKQRVLASLGRLDVLQQSGQIDGLLCSLERFSEKFAVLGAHANGECVTAFTRKIGPAMLVERVWRSLGIDQVLEEALAGRRFAFSLERSVFLTVLHRLFSPGSDRAAEKWREGYRIEGLDGVELHHLYRAMGWLGEPLAEPAGASALGPRTTKDRIEEALFDRRRTLFSDLSLVFFDTTSMYFEGEGGETLGQYGHSKDHRPDLRQIVVAVVLDQDGNPVCSEIWPGNITDVKTLTVVAERLKRRFRIERICLVADRGMISQAVLEALEREKWLYILGVRMRRCNEIRDEVLGRSGRYQDVVEAGQEKAPLKVKEVWNNGRRYIVCLNEDQATKDRHDRSAILASLREKLKAGDKALVGNKGYRRYLRTSGEHFQIDEEKIHEEERFDGKWVLTTNADLATAEIALQYKRLWTVEDIFRSMKSVLETRPIYHKCDDTIRGHVFCSFLALLIRKEIEDRLAQRKWKLEWAEVIASVDGLVETEINLRGKRYLIRSETVDPAGKVFQACGVALPPTLQQL
jgi:transposase